MEDVLGITAVKEHIEHSKMNPYILNLFTRLK